MASPSFTLEVRHGRGAKSASAQLGGRDVSTEQGAAVAVAPQRRASARSGKAGPPRWKLPPPAAMKLWHAPRRPTLARGEDQP